jgi:hypothetical protein
MRVSIVKPTSLKDIEEIDTIPTIIGTDFLRDKKFILFADIANDKSYIEKT